MLTKEQMGTFAEMIGINVDELTTAITSETEVALTLPEGRFLSKDNEATLLDNHGKKKYDEGKGKASKDLLDSLKTSSNIEFEGSDPTKFLEAYKGEVLKDAKVEPSKKIQELETSLETLRTTISEKDTAYAELQGSVDKDRTKFKAQALIPDLPENLGISKAEAADLFFMKHEVREDGIYKDGVKLKDSLEADISLDKAVEGFIQERGWNAAPSGRGGGSGGDGGGAGGALPKTMEDYQAHLKDKGINEGSAEANALLSEIAKENPEILDD